MAKPTLEERRLWWTYVYTWTSMDLAHRNCVMLLQVCDSNDHPLFLPLSTSLLVYYGRPFMPSKGKANPLPKPYFEVDSLEARIHDGLMTFRNKLVAHNDSDIIKAAGQHLHRVMYERSESAKGFYTRDPRFSLENCEDFEQHIRGYRIKVRTILDEYEERFADQIPTANGLFELNLSGEPDDTFVPLSTITEVLTFTHPDQEKLPDI